jgi:hypothetical protein
VSKRLCLSALLAAACSTADARLEQRKPASEPPCEDVEARISALRRAPPERRFEHVRALLDVADSAAAARCSDDSGRAAPKALRAIREAFGGLSSEEQEQVLSSLGYIAHEVALETLVESLDLSEMELRRQAAESLVRLARHFGTYPEMPRPFVSEPVFRASADADLEVARDCRCVLRIALSNIEGGKAWSGGGGLHERLQRQVRGVSLGDCY